MSKLFILNYLKFIFVSGVFLTSLTSCLDSRPDTKVDSAPATSLTWFSGIDSVQNLGGDPVSIQISWTTSTSAQKYRIYMIQQDSSGDVSLNLVEEVDNTSSGVYIHRDSSVLTNGGLYTYQVNAVDYTGFEDGNSLRKSTVAYPGIADVGSITKNSARVFLNQSQGSYNSIQIIAHPARLSNSDKTQDIKVNLNYTSYNSTTGVLVSGLRSGTTYYFKALVVINDDGDVDGNESLISKTTISDSFGSSDSSQTSSNFQFRGFRLVQAFGEAPNVLNYTTIGSNKLNTPSELNELTQPHQKMVKLIPNPFSSSGRFRVLRVPGTGSSGFSQPSYLDTTSTEICQGPTSTASATATACVVCDHAKFNSSTFAFEDANLSVANGDCDINMTTTPPTFVDLSVDPPPKKYFYTITKVNSYDSTLWPEELPQNNATGFMTAAHVPDEYMVMVHRDSVNYEMCGLLKKATDPVNHNRCNYQGVGAYPKNGAGESLIANVPTETLNANYDFGYNLLVNRYPLSCNWTRASTSTSCGPKGCISLSLNASTDATNQNDANTDYSLTNTSYSPGTLEPSKLAGSSSGDSSYAPYNIPTPSITTDLAYSNSPLTMLTLHSRGANCYSAFLNQANLVTAISSGADPAANSSTMAIAATPGSGAEWINIGRLAEIAISYRNAGNNPLTLDKLKNMVNAAATSDPGPLGNGFSDRKRPVITGLTPAQASALCRLQRTSYGTSGTKRLIRRREYVAASPLASFDGEPGYSFSNMKRILNGDDGQTQYNWNIGTGGINSRLVSSVNPNSSNTNPGGCGRNGVKAEITAMPCWCYNRTVGGTCNSSFNPTVSTLSGAYCDNANGCLKNGGNTNTQLALNTNSNSFTFGQIIPSTICTAASNPQLMSASNPSYATNSFSDLLDAYLDPKNEVATIGLASSLRSLSTSNRYFIGSLATNKCVSRFGLQDPYSSASTNVDGGATPNSFTANENTPYGYVFSDKFKQNQTGPLLSNSPLLEPVINNEDPGVIYDYEYYDSNNQRRIAKFDGTYFPTSVTGSQMLTARMDGTSTNTARSDLKIGCDFTTEVSNINPINYFQNNYFYLTSSSTAQVATPNCVSDSRSIEFVPSRSHTDFTGFLPVMGLPLSDTTLSTTNPAQTYVALSNLIFGLQFSSTATGQLTYARYLNYSNKTGSVTPLLHMSSGTGSRWSYEISEAASVGVNNSSMAWCGIEVE